MDKNKGKKWKIWRGGWFGMYANRIKWLSLLNPIKLRREEPDFDPTCDFSLIKPFIKFSPVPGNFLFAQYFQRGYFQAFPWKGYTRNSPTPYSRPPDKNIITIVSPMSVN